MKTLGADEPHLGKLDSETAGTITNTARLDDLQYRTDCTPTGVPEVWHSLERNNPWRSPDGLVAEFG